MFPACCKNDTIYEKKYLARSPKQSTSFIHYAIVPMKYIFKYNLNTNLIFYLQTKYIYSFQISPARMTESDGDFRFPFSHFVFYIF